MISRKSLFLFLILAVFSATLISSAQAQTKFVGAPPKPVIKTPPAPKPKPKPVHPSPVVNRCGKCGQTISPRTVHICPVAVTEGILNAIPRTITCRSCGARYNEGQRHVCRQTPQQPPQQARVVTCRNCGVRYYEGQSHRCRTTRQYPEIEGNALPPETASVEKGNHTTLKLASFDQQNIAAIRNSLLLPLKDAQIDLIEDVIPSEQAISDKINGMVTSPPLTNQEKADLLKAVKDGDESKIKDILKGKITVGPDESTLLGIAGAKDLLEKYNQGMSVKQSDIKSLIDTLKKGDASLLGKLSSELLTLGTLNKIDKILTISSAILSGGGSLTVAVIPTGIVPIVTFPGLPYGVVFSLGNGIFGIGTGGFGNTGIYQGYLPQPPVYADDNVSNWSMDDENNIVLHNDNDVDIKYYFVGDNDVHTIERHSWSNWQLGSQRRIGLPSGQSGKWSTSSFESGAYSIVEKAGGGFGLREEVTEIILKSPGNPVPFTFYVEEDKFVIEPGKSINLVHTDEGNGLFEIRFARSPDKEDIATHVVGGKMAFNIGRDKSDGKWTLFSEGADQVKPSTPQQNVQSIINPAILYDDTEITAANVGDLPVLPAYD